MSADHISALCLCRVRGIGLQKLQLLLKAFRSPSGVYSASMSSIRAMVHQLSPAIVEAIVSKEGFEEAKAIYAKCQEQQIALIFYTDSHYPDQLRQLSAPPLVLYAQGQLETLSEGTQVVALAGTRKMSSYGQQVIKAIGKALTSASKGSISLLCGLGDGVEICATSTALGLGLSPIVVFPSGLDKPYPPHTSQSLLDKLKGKGCLLSQHAPGVPVQRHSFAIRNYFMAGLSHVVVIVESGSQGGALALARYAFKENRDVWAVPGSIFSASSAGCHDLIKEQSARIFRSPEDVLKALGLTVGASSAQSTPDTPSASSADTNPPKPMPQLKGKEKNIFHYLLEQPKATHVDELSRAMELNIQDMHPLLVSLELQGLVVSLPGHYYKVESIYQEVPVKASK